MTNKLFATESEELELPAIEIDNDNFDEVYETLKEQELDLTNHVEDTQRILVAVEALNNLIIAKQSGMTPIALESYRAAAQMGTIGTGFDPDRLINPSLSLEALASQRDSFIGRLGWAFKSMGQKYVDYIHYFYSILEFQTSRLSKISNAINKSSIEDKAIKLPINKWMSYGKGPVLIKSGDDYNVEIQKVTKLLVPVCSGLDNLANEDLFSWFKWVKAIATVDTDNFIQERGESLRENLGGIIKKANLKREKEINGIEIYASDIMLGLFQIEIRIPNSKITISDDIKPSLYSLHLERIQKMNLPDWTKDKVEIEFSKKNIQAMIKSSNELLNEAKKLGGLGNRIAQFGSTFAINSTFSPVGAVSAYIGLLTQSGRLAMHVSGVILAAMSGVHNVAFGNVKQAASISEKFLK